MGKSTFLQLVRERVVVIAKEEDEGDNGKWNSREYVKDRKEKGWICKKGLGRKQAKFRKKAKKAKYSILKKMGKDAGKLKELEICGD